MMQTHIQVKSFQKCWLFVVIKLCFIAGLAQDELSLYLTVEGINTTWFPRDIRYIFSIQVQQLSIYSIFRFFAEGLDSSGTASLDACVREFHLNLFGYLALFVDDTNKCWFGNPSTSTGAVSLTGSSWTVYIKEGKLGWNLLLE